MALRVNLGSGDMNRYLKTAGPIFSTDPDWLPKVGRDTRSGCLIASQVKLVKHGYVRISPGPSFVIPNERVLMGGDNKWFPAWCCAYVLDSECPWPVDYKARLNIMLFYAVRNPGVVPVERAIEYYKGFL